jgi:mRNA deadenylase 3'-5' endonuclease subunit Ccr4
MVLVCTYNILSTKLVSPDWHVGVPGRYLETNHRWKLIKEKIAEKILDGYIICIQELSEEWISKLLVLFNVSNYTFVYDSNYLGVGIAFPNSYILEGMNIVCVGDELRKQCKFVKANTGYITGIYNWLASWVRTEAKDSWQLACDRKNRYLKVSLTDEKSNQFDVYTYHMPCAFTNPDLMFIQASALLNFVKREAGNKPYILAGDFNSRPSSEVYRMITKRLYKHVPSKHFHSTSNFITDCLKSAYGTINHYEPFFTCSAYSKVDGNLFRDTIDYIFYSDGFYANSVSQITTKRLPPIPFPSKDEGSDHIMISANLSFHNDNTQTLCINQQEYELS